MAQPQHDEDRFPAIARASQRFLERTKRCYSAAPHRHVQDAVGHGQLKKPVQRYKCPIVANGEPTSSDFVVQWMARFGKELDQDLELVGRDIDLIHTRVAQDYAALAESVDAFTAALVRGQPRIQTSSSHVAPIMAMGKLLKKGKSPAAIVLVAHRRRPRVAVRVTAASQRKMTSPDKQDLLATGASRAARLAKETVSAITLQRAARTFLYRSLYMGGPSQLAVAVALRRQWERKRWLRRWRVLVLQAHRMRRKMGRIEARSSQDMSERCHARAQQVIKVDGKFGQAKEYYRLKLLGVVWLAWLRSVACRSRDEVESSIYKNGGSS